MRSFCKKKARNKIFKKNYFVKQPKEKFKP